VGGEKERGVIERQVKHLVSMVDDLLDVSRVTRGKIELRRTRVELAEVVAQAIETASPLLEQHRHALTVEVPQQGLAVNADSARLAQVVANLLTNAAQIYPQRRARLDHGQQRRRGGVLAVRDSGIGIDPVMLGRIFEPSRRNVRRWIDRRAAWIGPGHRAAAWCRCTAAPSRCRARGAKKGTQFTVRLPLASGRSETPSRTQPVAPKAAASGAKRLLIVDDNEDAAEMLAEMLSSEGFAVRYALDGPAGLALAAEFKPDGRHPRHRPAVMDGFELAARFLDSPSLKRTRLIAADGYGQPEDRARSAAAGFAAHLVKPVDQRSCAPRSKD